MQRILTELQNIEFENNVSVLFACESGTLRDKIATLIEGKREGQCRLCGLPRLSWSWRDRRFGRFYNFPRAHPAPADPKQLSTFCQPRFSAVIAHNHSRSGRPT